MVFSKLLEIITQGKDIATEVLNNPAILDEYRDMLKGTSMESLDKAVISLITTSFTVNEAIVNEIIGRKVPDISIQFNDGHFILNAPYFTKITLTYDSCNFTDDERSVTLKMLGISLHARPFLGTVLEKFPFIEKSKDDDKTTLITCHLNKIPKLQDNKVINSPYLKYVVIDSMTCKPGKIFIKFKPNMVLLSKVYRELGEKIHNSVNLKGKKEIIKNALRNARDKFKKRNDTTGQSLPA